MSFIWCFFLLFCPFFPLVFLIFSFLSFVRRLFLNVLCFCVIVCDLDEEIDSVHWLDDPDFALSALKAELAKGQFQL